MGYSKEDLIRKFTERYQTLDLSVNKEYYSLNDRFSIACKKCNHSWLTSVKNALIFYLGCYNCHKGQNYSMDEIKILKYIEENYLPKGSISFQRIIYPKKYNIPDFVPPRYYSVDGYSFHSYVRKGNELEVVEGKGSVFEVLGDYHHSNPEYYKPDDLSPKKGYSHKQNFEYTMKRLKHIEEQGYKVFYIWVTDFKRFTRDMERKACLFDYMNVEKKI